MKSIYSILIIFLLAASYTAHAQAPNIVWQKTIGGTKNDSLSTILPTTDGGFIIAGHSNSNISGNKSQNAFAGSFDFWIVKLDAAGNILWNKTIGGNKGDLDPAIIQTSDGGYLVAGKSISDIWGAKTENAINQSYDYWVVKLNAAGTVLWNNTIGGIQLDVPVALAQAPDNSYILAGYSHTGGQAQYDKTDKNRGSGLWCDYWVANLNSTGTKVIWDKVYGGGNKDQLTSMKAIASGGYILGGYSYSPLENEKTETYVGNNDYWIVKIDTAGNKIFDKTIGGKLSDYLTAVQSTTDGGYILGGYSNSFISGNKTETRLGNMDYWVVKITATGVVQWNKTLGGVFADRLASIQQTLDGGYIAGGTSSSNKSATKSEQSKGKEDYWIVKLNSSGVPLWNKTIGGTGSDRLSIIKEITNGEYIAGGTSASPASGDKTSNTTGGNGQNDYWIVRLGSSAAVAKANNTAEQIVINKNAESLHLQPVSVSVTPNPTSGPVVVTYNYNSTEKLTLFVYDHTGNTIINNIQLPVQKGTYTLNLSAYAAGSYYISISSDKSRATRMIIKE